MDKYALKQTRCPSCDKKEMTEFTRYENVVTCADCGFKLFDCFTTEEMRQNNLIDAIHETLWAIEKDLDPYVRGDSMNYTGYLAENAAWLGPLLQPDWSRLLLMW
jgi:predicted  nucleic acid-binding Zn-ribbon protein